MRFEPLKAESELFLRLDLMRIVAASAIVLFHYSVSINGRAIVPGLTLFVDLFFVVSGIIIAHVYGDKIGSLQEFGTFIQKRIARLGPLHWATLLFFIGVGAIETGPKYDPNCIIPNITLTQAWGVCETRTYN